MTGLRRKTAAAMALLCATGLIPASAASAADCGALAADLQEAVEALRNTSDVTALAAAVATPRGLACEAVAGERRRGSGETVRPGDQWHIASSSKPMTSLLYGLLVERGRMSQ